MIGLELEGVKFAYPSREILHGITFKAGSGEILGIIGQNGCGKTTLLKCINATLKTSAGKITVDGTDVSVLSKREIAKRMGFVMQTASTTFPFTVYETVLMGRYARKGLMESDSEEDERAVYQAMRDTGIVKFADRDIDELSGGERRRVMIARALVQEPDILLLDEPTLHLDINHQFDLMDLITRLAREKDMLVVLVTHDIILAARYCSRVIAVIHGRIGAAGSVEEVFTEDNMRDLFDIETEISEDARVGRNITIIGKYHGDDSNFEEEDPLDKSEGHEGKGND